MTQEEEKILRSDSIMPSNENPLNSDKDDSCKKKAKGSNFFARLFKNNKQ